MSDGSCAGVSVAEGSALGLEAKAKGAPSEAGDWGAREVDSGRGESSR